MSIKLLCRIARSIVPYLNGVIPATAEYLIYRVRIVFYAIDTIRMTANIRPVSALLNKTIIKIHVSNTHLCVLFTYFLELRFVFSSRHRIL